MNFPGHIKGAIVAGAVVGTVAVASGQVELSAAALEEFVRDPRADTPFRKFFGVILLAWFMGLFPDLDTGSTPRKHYFRWLLGLFTILFLLRDLELLGFMAIFSVLPMLGKHRGWTHWWITPWVLSAALAVLIEYLRVRNASSLWIFFFGGFSLGNAFDWWLKNWIYAFAFVVGHWTHLILDTEWIKSVPIIGQDPSKKPRSRRSAASDDDETPPARKKAAKKTTRKKSTRR